MGLTWEACGGYVPVMERNHNPTAQEEMERLMDLCADLGQENKNLYGERRVLAELLCDATALLRTIDPEDVTEGEQLEALIDRAEKAYGAILTPNVKVTGA